ncbi:murein biosynthesis integral membrane protein MurJ [Synechococcus sp. CCY 9618]|uniref:murein biosynthesis integral membrane protein MurJ n=1 Tax=Synechococcus sp. CCY 9618 TaxID=2815602 RepID=UPI001C21F0E8
MPAPARRALSGVGERRSLLGIAGVVGVATALSKGLGLARSMAVAAVFGVGAVADAFAFATMLPGFFLVVLGGQNGPLQSALVSVLSQDEGLDQQRLIGWAQRGLTLVLLPLSLGIVLAAGPLLELLAPGLSDETRQLAVLQLRWMAPIVLLSGWIGVAMARLISAGVYAIPSLSPMLSSAAVIAAAAVAMAQGRWFTPGSPTWMAAASRTLALGMVLGALLQWLLQQLAMGRLPRAAEPAPPRPAGTNRPAAEAKRKVLALLAPATLTTALGSANATVDLIFASYLPGVAAALGYAEVLVQAPRGWVASMLLVPLLPAIARQAAQGEPAQLRERVTLALRLTGFVAVPLAALVAALAEPMVATLYQRRAFDPESTRQVAGLLLIYGIGIVPSLVRDVMVRVFYGLGDGATPFRVGLASVVLNVVLDAALVQRFGAPGLVLASVGVNLFAALLLAIALERALGGIAWWSLSGDLLAKTLAGLLAALAAWSLWQMGGVLPQSEAFPMALLRLAAAGAAGALTFLAVARLLGIRDGERILRGRTSG